MPPAKQPNKELIDYQFTVMNEKIESHQEYTKGEFQSLHNKLDKFISSADEKFATKEEHAMNRQSIEEIRSAHNKIAWSAISFMGATILGFAGFVLKKLGII